MPNPKDYARLEQAKPKLYVKRGKSNQSCPWRAGKLSHTVEGRKHFHP